VTGSPEVEGVVRGPDGLAASLKQGSVIIDCSTSNPVSTGALAAELAPRGIDFVDAPLSRTPKEAWEGTLDTMIGANDAVFQRVKPIIETWAGKIVHVGGVGDGHRMKLLNNFLSMGYAALYSEALVAAAKVGISPQRFDSVIRGGRMDNPFYQTFMRWTLEGERNAHKFSISNAFKDMRYLESMMDAAGVANPVGNAIKNSFALAVSAGAAEEYVPMLATHIARLNGVDLAPKSAGAEPQAAE
jgi:3-hydroxyisobutyrate dehydrogenase-like beta-hydroxyacid dehydrogenase